MLKATKRILIPRRSHGQWFWLQIVLSLVFLYGAGLLAHNLVFAQFIQTTCSPANQSATPGAQVSFTASGGDGRVYSWAAPTGTTTSGSGPTFSTSFTTTGQHVVKATSAGVAGTCLVQVSATAGSYATSWLADSTPFIQNNEIVTGQNYTINVRLTNNTSSSSSVTMRVKNPNTTYVIRSGSSGPTPSGGSHSYGFCEDASSPDRCWNWVIPTLSPGQTFDGNLTFSADPSTPSGTILCFVSYAQPNGTGTPQGQSQRCLTVTGGGSGTPVRPYFTSDGSIHAGARFGSETCLETGTDTVQGQSGSSRSSLAVSAAGRITNFGSGGTAAGTNLTFGNQNPADLGYYGQVCRPDLYQVYDNLQLNPETTLNMGQIPEGISRYGNLTLTGGTVPRDFNATIVVDGTLTITGNITYTSTGYISKADIPSFGVIAADNINIASNVSQIYGIYYAGSSGHVGRINTCQSTGSYPNPVITSNAGACNTPLTINGALIGTSIYFRRTATASAAEVVNYLPQLMLNPPIGLSSVAEQL